MIFKSTKFSEQAYIWSAWGECNANTCLQRRSRKCQNDEECPGSGTSLDKDHADFVEEGWEKFDRRCSDHSNCFAEATNQLSDGK